MKKIRVGILFGGRSGEHEVSLLSAASVLQAIDRKKYEVIPIGITKEGRWVTRGPRRAPPRRARSPASTCAPAIPMPRPRPLCSAKANPSSSRPFPSEALVPFRDPRRARRPCPGTILARPRRIESGPLRRRHLSRSSTAPSAKTAPSRACSSWPASPTSARASSAPPPAWTRTPCTASSPPPACPSSNGSPSSAASGRSPRAKSAPALNRR